MLLSLHADHKEHLKLLTNQPPQGKIINKLNHRLQKILLIPVVVDFCKLAIDFLQNGPNLKLYASAANKLEVEPESVQNCVYGLLNLLLLSCKHKVRLKEK